MSDIERDEAVRLAGEVGAKVAGERLGVPASTVRAWASKQRRSEGEPAAAGVSERQSSSSGGLDDIERLRRDVTSIQRLMQRAVQHANRALQDGKSADAQRAAVTMGISADKLGQLSSVLSGLESQRVRLAGDQGQVIAAVVQLAFQAVGVPITPAVRAVLRELLEQAGKGGPLAPSPALSQPAYAEVRGAFEERLRREIVEEFQAEHRALPAPAADDQGELEETVPEPADRERESSEDEIPDADVMPDLGSEDPMHPVIGRARPRPWTARSSRGAVGVPDRHGIFGPGSSMRHPPGGGV